MHVNLIRLSFFVITWIQCEKIFQFPLQCLECWSSHWIFVPAFKHYFVQCLCTIRWTWHTVAVFNLTQHFGISHSWNPQMQINWHSNKDLLFRVSYGGMIFTWIRNTTVCHQLGKQNTKAPDIGFYWEFTIVGCLGCGPLDRESSTDTCLILIFFD